MSLPARVLIVLIRGYRRWISPFLRPKCRFHPSCSNYALDALVQHGAIKGAGLTLTRIARCHPWSEGGIDPVPSRGHEVTG